MKYLLILFALASFTFFTACNEGAKSEEGMDSSVVNNDATVNDEGAESNAGKAQIKFDEMEHDFQTITEGSKASYTFTFTNTGNSDLIISDTKASCGCTTPTYTKEPVRPGEQGSIDVVYNSEGRPGSFTKTIRVTSNTEPNENVLTIKGEVK